MLPATPTIVVAAAVVVLAFVLGRATGGGGDEPAAVSTPTQPSSTTTTTRIRTHTVTRGESLLGIASQYGVTLDALTEANGITNQNHVFVGQVLTIPPSTAPVGLATTTSTSAAAVTTTRPR
jgi:LysM repeat protein